MTRLHECRLIVDPPLAGSQNMAIDECLLADAAENGIATLRFYQWSEPTLSLGYFQHYDDRYSHPASRDCAIVRRQTGGGAILHDRELTYSVILPASHPRVRGLEQLYEAVHDAFIAELAPLIARQSPWCVVRLVHNSSSMSHEVSPFLCFQRRARWDVLLTAESGDSEHRPTRTSDSLQTVKILGSAQRRYRGCILQHGSLLLERSPSAPELAGWCDITGIDFSIAQRIDYLTVRLLRALDLGNPSATTLPIPSCEVQSNAAALANSKYGSAAWTKRR
jgi:lipoate-protein ligase A